MRTKQKCENKVREKVLKGNLSGAQGLEFAAQKEVWMVFPSRTIDSVHVQSFLVLSKSSLEKSVYTGLIAFILLQVGSVDVVIIHIY